MPRAFNPATVLANIAYVKDLIRRIRQKESGIGSEGDELVLSRLVFDLDFLIELAEALGTNNKKLMEMLQAQQRGGQSESAGTSGAEGEERGRDPNIQLDQTSP